MISIGIKDIIDILLFSIVLYQMYKLLKGTQAMNIFFAVIGFVILWFLVLYVFRMDLLGSMMDKIMSFGALILIIIFQDEIKSFLSSFGSHTSHGLIGRIKSFVFTRQKQESDADIEAIAEAAENCARTKTGLLIILQNNADLSTYSKTGEFINSRISARLIENIFFKNTPLHDGALIINGGKIVSAGCILPVSHNLDIPKHFGLRHRAALGITEKTDAISIIVSEETGGISVAQNGEIVTIQDIIQLKQILTTKNIK